MSDKRKSLRHIFTIGSFSAILIFIVGFFILCFYFFIRFVFVLGSLGGAEPENKTDSVTIVHKISANEFQDSLAYERPKTEFPYSLFSFDLTYDSIKDGNGEWESGIKTITIFRISDHKKIQTVFPSDPWRLKKDERNFRSDFTVEDMNFDGYADFRVLGFIMMRGQTFYLFWIYNPEKGIFEENKELEKTWDVHFDHKEKTITSNERRVGPFDVVNKVFTWKNGQLILQHKEESEMIDPQGESGNINMTKRINGKLIKRSRYFDTIPITKEGQVIFNWDSLK